MKTFTIGDVAVSSIIERDGPWRKPTDMFPTADPHLIREHLLRLEPFVYDAVQDLIVITYQTFIVRTHKHTILIDTCVGENKPNRGPALDYSKQPWLDGLAAEGLSFEDIDYVFCTHLHIDHCGWNTRLINGKWVPTFPNAKYIFSKRDYDYWAAETEKGSNPPGDVWADSCLPIVEAGQALLVDDDYALDDDIWLTPTPGHSPGHVCVNVNSSGKHGIFTGDLMHHALQCLEPDWSSCFCYDPAESSNSRRKIFEAAAGTDTIIVPTHFPGVTAGHIKESGDNFRFHFLGS
jgi:glyoxylase-like metal-dependent hydrolase (beta-lactamase superfamily II)